MKLDRIKATNIELTEAIRTAIVAEMATLDHLTQRYGESAAAQIEVGKTTQHHHKGPFFRAEINVVIPGGMLRAEAEHEDLYTAIKDATKKMHHELAHAKDKHDTSKHVDAPEEL